VTTPAGYSVLFDLFLADSAARELLRPVVAPTGLTAVQYAEYSILHVDGPMSVSTFAALARLPLATASDTLRAMERRGHVERSRDPDDGRAWLVDLSDSGRAQHERSRRAFRRAATRVSRMLGDAEPDVRAALRLLADACARASEETHDGPRP
jgi:DNA-binding MarR family transcriptional regulator